MNGAEGRIYKEGWGDPQHLIGIAGGIAGLLVLPLNAQANAPVPS
jgi:hypothetical protein